MRSDPLSAILLRLPPDAALILPLSRKWFIRSSPRNPERLVDARLLGVVVDGVMLRRGGFRCRRIDDSCDLGNPGYWETSQARMLADHSLARRHIDAVNFVARNITLH